MRKQRLFTDSLKIAVIVWSVFQSRQHFFKAYGLIEYALDFVFNVGLILLSTTLYADSPIQFGLMLLVPCLFLYLLRKPTIKESRPWTKRTDKTDMVPLPDYPLKPFLTTYRGCMMVITCIAILAVDFRIFPRRFAKTENWGTSLMDLGVGSFVFSAGLVAARPILKESISRPRSLARRLQESFQHSVPLLVLGFIRLWSVKGLDYAEHVTEYGVHWNFFFTLAFVPPFVALFQSVYNYIPSYALLSILLGGAYEVALNFTDLKAFILVAPRVDLFSQNREGIFSFFGYLAIFLAGQALGMVVIPRRAVHTGPGDGRTQRMKLLITLLIWTAIWTALYRLTTSYSYGLNIQVSRRLANLPYFLWVAAFNTAQLTAFCGIETLFFSAFYQATDKVEEDRAYIFATSRVLAAYNKNGLAIFLVANLLTGAVNLLLPTLRMNHIQAITTLLAYTGVLTIFALTMHEYNITLKMPGSGGRVRAATKSVARTQVGSRSGSDTVKRTKS